MHKSERNCVKIKFHIKELKPESIISYAVHKGILLFVFEHITDAYHKAVITHTHIYMCVCVCVCEKRMYIIRHVARFLKWFTLKYGGLPPIACPLDDLWSEAPILPLKMMEGCKNQAKAAKAK